jgi:uncharacterized protein (DUF1800 family)
MRRLALVALLLLGCRSAPPPRPETQPAQTPVAALPEGLTASPLRPAEKAAHLLNRLAFGPRPGEIDALARGGDAALWAWVERQLAPSTIDDSEVDARLAPLPTLGLTNAQLRQEYPSLNELAKVHGIDLSNESAKRELQAAVDPDQLVRRVEEDLAIQKLVRATESRRQLQEVLLDFWFNHFNVDLEKGADRWLVTTYERDALRPHLFGRFRDLLGAVAHSPAMLFYLDNWQSFRDQPANPRHPNQPHGLNENYARELMELHTLGVSGGYTQKDVREAARCLTGWSIERPNQIGSWIFRERQHDEGAKVILGVAFPANRGEADGERLLDLLASSPATAHFLATKLARHFVSDDPPPSLVERLAQRYLATGGDLTEVYRELFGSPEFWSRQAYRAKVKDPLEMAVSSVRALDGHLDAARPFEAAIAAMGERIYRCQPPTGYPDTAQAWVNSGSLVARLDFGLALAAGRLPGVHGHLLPFTPGRRRADPGPFVREVEQQLLGGPLTPETEKVVLEQLAPETRAMPDGEVRPLDVRKLAGLILGSPEFQRR